jgi:hypothetical protein
VSVFRSGLFGGFRAPPQLPCFADFDCASRNLDAGMRVLEEQRSGRPERIA